MSGKADNYNQPVTNEQPGYGGPPPNYGGPPPQGYAGQGYAGPQQPGYGMQPTFQQPIPGQPPGPVVWMQRPEPIPGCPPGLEYLTKIDQLLVHQQVQLLEVVTNWEVENKYQIKNSVGQQIYFASEESDTCMRQCCKANRGFVLHITDNLGQEVIRVVRQFKCCAGFGAYCCSCCAGAEGCANEVAIEAPPGTVVGYFRQRASCCGPKFSILDAQRDDILQVEGPCCFCQAICCTGDRDFVVSSEGGQVGKLSKQWAGFLQEAFTNAQNFRASFPIDLDVKVKAIMLSGIFIIDFMFYEQKQNRNN